MRPHRPLAALPPTGLALALLLVGVPVATAWAAKVPTKMPEDKVRGRELYQDLCWQCHGVDGRGDGPLAAVSAVPPGDLRGRAEEQWPELVQRVLQGQGDMPAFGDSLDRHEARRILVWLAALDAGESAVAPTRVAPDQPVDSDLVLPRAVGPVRDRAGPDAAEDDPDDAEAR